jgi:peptide chain release factor 3
VHDGTPVVYPGIPVFAPELIATARPTDVSNQKRFRKGLEQMAAEGVIQILHRPGGDATPILAAVGAMQFEVLVHRLEHEFGSPVYLEPPAPRTVRRTDSATAAQLSSLGGVDVLEREDGTLLALFASPYRLQRLATDNPEWLLDPIVTT